MLFTKKPVEMYTDVEGLRNKYVQLMSTYVKREGVDDLLYYLDNHTDFFDAPASTKYHGNFHGGLCLHSLNVAKELIKSLYAYGYIKKGEPDENTKIESAYLAALTHDLCKTNFYRWGTRNVKDENGKWVTVPYIDVDEDFPFGHGEKSVYLVSKYIKLTDEEAVAIRWHMGDYSEAKGACSQGFNLSPLALFLHQADERAASLLEKTYDYVHDCWEKESKSWM